MVELGCAPGGWLQVLAARVGASGSVLGVDAVAVDPVASQVQLLELDFSEVEGPDQIAAALACPADALLSDAAPKLTGIRDIDRAAEEEIYEAVWRVAERILRPAGALVVKGFPGSEADAFRERLRSRFPQVAEVRPEAKRSTSKEHYWVARAPADSASRRPDRRRRKRPRTRTRTQSGSE